MEKVIVSDDGCWNWNAAMLGVYGGFFFQSGIKLAHRVAYEIFVGPIPKKHDVDHLCRNTRCVNPAHLEAVTHAENVRRAMQGYDHRKNYQNKLKACPRGHRYNKQNTRVDKNGWRHCRLCHT